MGGAVLHLPLSRVVGAPLRGADRTNEDQLVVIIAPVGHYGYGELA